MKTIVKIIISTVSALAVAFGALVVYQAFTSRDELPEGDDEL